MGMEDLIGVICGSPTSGRSSGYEVGGNVQRWRTYQLTMQVLYGPLCYCNGTIQQDGRRHQVHET
jgi:hypothetical protein